jgi:hypothetical protein
MIVAFLCSIVAFLCPIAAWQGAVVPCQDRSSPAQDSRSPFQCDEKERQRPIENRTRKQRPCAGNVVAFLGSTAACLCSIVPSHAPVALV